MKYFKSILFVILSCVLGFRGTAFGALDDALKDAWGIKGVSLKDVKCQSFNLPESACVGKGACSKDGNQGVGVSNGNKPQHAVLLFVAHTLNEHGAKFCATQVQANRNAIGDRPWLRYYWPSGNEEICFWVCSDGYGGNECKEANSEKVVDTQLSKQSFSDLELSFNNSTNVKKVSSSVYPMINNNIVFALPQDDIFCGHPLSIYTEHNAFFGVVDYTSDGHGVIAQAMVAHPSTKKAGAREADIEVTTFGSKRIFCSSGYKPSGESCVLTNPSTSGSGTTSAKADLICNGWVNTDLMLSKDYKKYYPEGMDCYQYRCADESMGFTSNTDYTCIKCTSSKQKGIDDNGVCITCEGNQMFDTNTKKCREPIVVSNQELIYGIGKNPSNTSDINDQCWIKLEASDYENCFFGK